MPSLPGGRARLGAVAGPGQGASPEGTGAPRQGHGWELALLLGARPPRSPGLRYDWCVSWPRRPCPSGSSFESRPSGLGLQTWPPPPEAGPSHGWAPAGCRGPSSDVVRVTLTQGTPMALTA